MPTVAEMRAKRALLLGQATELADKPEMTAEDRSKFDELIAEADKLAADIARREKLAIENAALAKTTGRAVDNARTVSFVTELGDNEDRAFEHWVRTGDAGGIQQLRASNATDMNIGTAADGGYAVPTGHYNQIIAKRDEDMLATKIGVTAIEGVGTTTNVPVDDEADGEFVVTTEANEFDLDAPAIDQKALTKLLYSKQVKLSYQLLQDERSNIMDFLANFVARGLAKTHNALLVTEALANGTASLTLDAAATIGATEIPELTYKQKDGYTDNSVWIMRRTTEGLIRGLSGNPFLYVPNPQGSMAGRPEIWGYPVFNTSKVAAVAASAKSLIFGDFSFMGLYEDPGLTFLRDPYTLAHLGQVRILYYFRADYAVLQAEAIHYATHPSA